MSHQKCTKKIFSNQILRNVQNTCAFSKNFVHFWCFFDVFWSKKWIFAKKTLKFRRAFTEIFKNVNKIAHFFFHGFSPISNFFSNLGSIFTHIPHIWSPNFLEKGSFLLHFILQKKNLKNTKFCNFFSKKKIFLTTSKTHFSTYFTEMVKNRKKWKKIKFFFPKKNLEEFLLCPITVSNFKSLQSYRTFCIFLRFSSKWAVLREKILNLTILKLFIFRKMVFLKNTFLCHTLQKKTPFLPVFLAIFTFFSSFFFHREESKFKNTSKKPKFKNIKKRTFTLLFI